MTKKELKNRLDAWLASRGMDGNWGHKLEWENLRDLFLAIIDALPDEPEPTPLPTCIHCGKQVKNGEMYTHVWRSNKLDECYHTNGCPVGPEPVEVKASEPTSELRALVRLAIARIEEWDDINEVRFIKVIHELEEGLRRIMPMESLISAWMADYGTGGTNDEAYGSEAECREYNPYCRRFVRLREEFSVPNIPARNADLGQHSDPPATGDATQPPMTASEFTKILKQGTDAISSMQQIASSEDARKLRIIKAMEDLAKQHASIDQVAKFQFYEGNWEIVGSIGTQKINEFYSPEAGGHEATDERGSVETSALKEDIAKWSARALEQQHKCGELIGLVRYAAQKLRKHGVTSVSRKVSVRLHAILDSDPMGTAVPSGVPATPKSVSEEPLWEGELLVSSKAPEEFGRVYGGWHVHQRPEFGWRKIKVKEQR